MTVKLFFYTSVYSIGPVVRALWDSDWKVLGRVSSAPVYLPEHTPHDLPDYLAR
jgi:hypothetical protein